MRSHIFLQIREFRNLISHIFWCYCLKMSQIIFTQSDEIVDEHPQLHTPSWVEETYLETQYEMGEENIDDEAILEFEAVDEEDEEPLIETVRCT